MPVRRELFRVIVTEIDHFSLVDEDKIAFTDLTVETPRWSAEDAPRLALIMRRIAEMLESYMPIPQHHYLAAEPVIEPWPQRRVETVTETP